MDNVPSKKSILPSWFRSIGLRKSRVSDTSAKSRSTPQSEPATSTSIGVRACMKDHVTRKTSQGKKTEFGENELCQFSCDPPPDDIRKKAHSDRVSRKVQFGPDTVLSSRSSTSRLCLNDDNKENMFLGATHGASTKSILRKSIHDRTSNLELSRPTHIDPNQIDVRSRSACFRSIPRTSTTLEGVDKRGSLSSLKESPIVADSCTQTVSVGCQRKSSSCGKNHPLDAVGLHTGQRTKSNVDKEQNRPQSRFFRSELANVSQDTCRKIWYFGPDLSRTCSDQPCDVVQWGQVNSKLRRSTRAWSVHNDVLKPSVKTSSSVRWEGGTLPRNWKPKGTVKDDDLRSNLADDECSMNCSCSVCTARAARRSSTRAQPISYFFNEPDRTDVKVAEKKILSRHSRSRENCHTEAESFQTSQPTTAMNAAVNKPLGGPNKAKDFSTAWYECKSPDQPGERGNKAVSCAEQPVCTYGNENISTIVERVVKQSIDRFLSLNAIPLLKSPPAVISKGKLDAPSYVNLCAAAPTDNKNSKFCVPWRTFSLQGSTGSADLSNSLLTDTFRKLLEECKAATGCQSETLDKGRLVKSVCNHPSPNSTTASRHLSGGDESGIQCLSVSKSLPEDHSGDAPKGSTETHALHFGHADRKDPSRQAGLSPTSQVNCTSSDGWKRIQSSGDSSSIREASSGDRSSIDSEVSEGTEKHPRAGLRAVTRSSRQGCIPRSPAKYHAKDILTGRAKLKLAIYANYGIVTVYVMRAAKLLSGRCHLCNAYVKVALQPDNTKRANWRTCVVKSSNTPVFEQKFSFEIGLEDHSKRLVISVWHRDIINRRSEFLGCMSFGISHVRDPTQNINGWYRLLTEAIGIQKHFAARAPKAKNVRRLNDSALMVSRSCLV